MFHSYERLATISHESKMYIYRVSRRKNGILHLEAFVSFNKLKLPQNKIKDIDNLILNKIFDKLKWMSFKK